MTTTTSHPPKRSQLAPSISASDGSSSFLAGSKPPPYAVAAASSRDKSLEGSDKNKVDMASEVGKMLAAKATEQGVSNIVFDRGGYLYHGRVKSLAEGARNGGLKF